MGAARDAPTRFHYNGGEPSGKVRSLATGLSSGDGKELTRIMSGKCLRKKRRAAGEKSGADAARSRARGMHGAVRLIRHVATGIAKKFQFHQVRKDANRLAKVKVVR